MSISSLSNVTGTFQRKRITPDALKLGPRELFDPLYPDVRFSLQAAKGDTREEFLRRGFVISHVAYMDYALALVSGDRLAVGATFYIVTGPQEDMGGRGRAYRVGLLQKDE